MSKENKKTPKYISIAMRRLSRIGHKKLSPEERRKRSLKAINTRWEKHRRKQE